MKPHKWAKEIKAWADGAEIETLLPSGQWELVNAKQHLWDNHYEYRIKPQPKEPQYLYVYGNGHVTMVSLEKAEDNSGVPLVGKIKLETEE